ncbi:MAG: hypothetical protein ABJC26_15375 [Gemmatimonadaceae bacterium]
MASRMMWRNGISLTITAALISACGSSSTGTDKNNNTGTTNCTMTLSGAQSGTATCTAGNAVLDRGENNSGFAFNASGTPGLSAHVKVPGPAADGTYQFSGVAFGTVVLTNGASEWYAEDNSGGTMSMTITSVSTISSTSTLIAYQAHGTMTATLIPLTGTPATGNVTMTLTF